MNPLVILGVLGKGLNATVLVITYWPIIHLTLVCFGIASVYNYLRALMETPMFYLFAMWYDLNFDIYIPEGMTNFTNNYIPNGMANFTNNTMFRPVSGFSSRFDKRFSNLELILMLVCMSLILLNVLRRIFNKESPPKLENDDWQGIWRGLGKVLEAWGPAVSWDFTLEHLWDPEKLSQYLSQGLCGLHKSKEVQLIWGLACAYRALYNTILERESFRAEVQAKGENPQVKSNRSQETPVTIPVAPVEGKKWKRVSSRLERKREEEEEEVEEDPGEGPSSEPPPSRKAKGKTKRRAEESDEEEVSITTRRPLKMTEIQGSRKEFTRHPNETLVSWLVRCWDSGAHSLSLDGNEARQLGAIARDPAIDRGISRCSDEAASLWERVLTAVKEKYPFKNGLKIAMKKWDTVEKGIQYLREIGVVEMLYDPNFVPNHPHQDNYPEKVRTTPEVWQKLVTTAPDKYAATLMSACDR